MYDKIREQFFPIKLPSGIVGRAMDRDAAQAPISAMNHLIFPPGFKQALGLFAAPAARRERLDRLQNPWENASPGFTLRDAGHFLASLQTWAGGGTQHVGWFMDGLQDERALCQKESSEIRDWETFTLSIWANYFKRQGHQEQATRILDTVRAHLSSSSLNEKPRRGK